MSAQLASRYGEILFVGGCNLKCFYCISDEMHNLQREKCKNSQTNTHFSQWKDFDKFLASLKKNKINRIYISSTIAEPLMYRYFDSLVDYLQNEKGFIVGLRSNAYFYNKKDILKLKGTISFSMNSMVPETNYKICKNSKVPNWKAILDKLAKNNKRHRITIVVNRYNVNEIESILDFLSGYSKSLSYVQLRKVYKYDGVEAERFRKDEKVYDRIVERLMKKYPLYTNFHESTSIRYKNGLQVSFWDTVFSEESIQSINYFTDGTVSTSNLLVPGYEDTKKDFGAGATTGESIVEYYTKQYNEDNRLKDGCDNRHLVEREVKKRVIAKYLKNKNSVVLDCAAGTGLYTKWLLDKGYKVFATDIVEDHVKQINKKCGIKAVVADARKLPYRDNSFDVVLLAGALYHLDKNSQQLAIKEMYRVCKPGGYVLFDYLSDYHGIIQHELLDNNFLNNFDGHKIDETFTYNNIKEMKVKIEKHGFKFKDAYGTDGITRFIREDINKLNREQIKKYIDFVYKNCSNLNIIDLSEHCIIVGEKRA